MAVIDLSRTSKTSLVRSAIPTMNIGLQAFRLDDINPSLEKFNQFWDYMETIQLHGYTRAALSVIGRTAIGAWWKLREHEEYGNKARDLQRRKLYSFYMMTEGRAWDNIKDYWSFAYKLMMGVQHLRYFGQAAYEILRNEAGTPIGLDFLHGLVIPNVESDGSFKKPAFVQYLSNDTADRVDFDDPFDVVFIANPDWTGSVWGGSDIESLANYTLPLDIYLQSAATNYMQNRDRPEAIFQVSPDLNDDAFDALVTSISELYSGPTNIGKGLVVTQGDVKVQELSTMPESLPYQQARQDTRDEILAVTGTAGSKLGLDRLQSNANMRETRREFHETSMIPLFRMVELGFYEQIHVREFSILGWEFKFNNPDFLNAVERATVDLRYWTMGVQNPNEMRQRQGMKPRTDEQGDMYADQLRNQPNVNQPGSPPEGRPNDPGAPAEVGEPNLDDSDPVRGDGHDDVTREDILSGEAVQDLRKWRSFALKRKRSDRPLRIFESEHIPMYVSERIQAYLDMDISLDEIATIFDEILGGYSNGEDY